MPLNKEEKKQYDADRRERFRKEKKCVRCGSETDGVVLHCSKCSDYFKTKAINKQKERLSSGLCRGCGAQPVPGKRDCQACLNRQAKNQAHRAANLKLEVFNHYGGPVCAEEDCHETDIDVLTLDHINEDGAKERRLLKDLYGIAKGNRFYVYLKKNNYPSGYQVLCMNHNWKKHFNHNRSIKTDG